MKLCSDRLPQSIYTHKYNLILIECHTETNLTLKAFLEQVAFYQDVKVCA